MRSLSCHMIHNQIALLWSQCAICRRLAGALWCGFSTLFHFSSVHAAQGYPAPTYPATEYVQQPQVVIYTHSHKHMHSHKHALSVARMFCTWNYDKYNIQGITLSCVAVQ